MIEIEDLEESKEMLLVSVIFVFGVIIGSFLNVLIYRIPEGESIVFPFSKCRSCKKALKWWHKYL